MKNVEKKGITTRVDLEHHAKARQYMSEHGNMNMEAFITRAIDSLVNAKEGTGELQPEKQRTIAFQVPESVYQKLKDRLKREKVNQKDFMTGLLEKELENDIAEDDMAQKQNEEQGNGDEEPNDGEDEDESQAERERFFEGDEPEDEEESEGMAMTI